MTALGDVIRACDDLGPVPPNHIRWVLVGPSALRAIKAEDPQAQSIGFRYGEAHLLETSSFDGWEVIDRPEGGFRVKRHKVLGKRLAK